MCVIVYLVLYLAGTVIQQQYQQQTSLEMQNIISAHPDASISLESKVCAEPRRFGDKGWDQLMRAI